MATASDDTKTKTATKKSARAAGQTVYVDFTARWCATCQTNKAAVFHNDSVLAALAKQKVVLAIKKHVAKHLKHLNVHSKLT